MPGAIMSTTRLTVTPRAAAAASVQVNPTGTSYPTFVPWQSKSLPHSAGRIEYETRDDAARQPATNGVADVVVVTDGDRVGVPDTESDGVDVGDSCAVDDGDGVRDGVDVRVAVVVAVADGDGVCVCVCVAAADAERDADCDLVAVRVAVGEWDAELVCVSLALIVPVRLPVCAAARATRSTASTAPRHVRRPYITGSAESAGREAPDTRLSCGRARACPRGGLRREADCDATASGFSRGRCSGPRAGLLCGLF